MNTEGPVCSEIAAVAHEVRRSGATRYDYPLGEAFAMIAARLEYLVRGADQVLRADLRPAAEAPRLEHMAQAHIRPGPQQRNLLDLAERLRAMTDAHEPVERSFCTFCGECTWSMASSS